MLTKRFFQKCSSYNVIGILGWSMAILMFQPGLASGATVQQFAANVTETFKLVEALMVRASYLCGTVFMIIGMLKFKAHKEAPAQIPLSTPVVLIAVSAGLLFLPTVFDLAGDALFSSSAKSGAFL